MKTKNKVVKHYRDFFDLHAKGIGLTEDDHLNIDWAVALAEDLKSEQTTSQQQTIEKLRESLRLSNEWLKKIAPYMGEHAGAVQYGITQNEQLLNTTEPMETSKAKGE